MIFANMGGHRPRRRRIQYAALPQFSRQGLRLLDAPPSRGMTSEARFSRKDAIHTVQITEFYIQQEN
jgi:hypothetical protein